MYHLHRPTFSMQFGLYYGYDITGQQENDHSVLDLVSASALGEAIICWYISSWFVIISVGVTSVISPNSSCFSFSFLFTNASYKFELKGHWLRMYNQHNRWQFLKVLPNETNKFLSSWEWEAILLHFNQQQ